MPTDPEQAAESTAERVALWRAMHVQVDAPPHVFEDEVGLQLLAPDEGWRKRRDMDPQGTSTYRAAIVARARFVEDLVAEQAARGVRQYVILGAGLDTFAQRRPELASTLRIFEVDQPGPQAWKRRRLQELGFGIPKWLKLVPVDFEARSSFWDDLAAAGYATGEPAIVISTGVTMYLTREAIMATLRQMTALAPGSTFATTFMLPLELVNPEDRSLYAMTMELARAAGTPFISLFSPEDMLDLARQSGLRQVRHVSTDDLKARYFAGRSDGLRPSSGEHLLIATI